MTISATMESDVRDFITVSNAVHRGMLEGINTAAKFILDLASQLAPVDEGDLRDSGQVGQEGEYVTISFGNGLPDNRAIAQEYGTVYMPAQPYLTVAAKEIDVVQIVAEAVIKRLPV